MGVDSVDGATEVPAEESDSPGAETPGLARLGTDAGRGRGRRRVAEAAADAESPVEAGGRSGG